MVASWAWSSVSSQRKGDEQTAIFFVAPFSGARDTPLATRLAQTATATRDPEQASPGEHFTGSPEPDDTAVFAMLSRSAKRALSRADRMRRDMKHDRVHIEHLVAGMEQDPESTATAALCAAAVDQAKLRELIHDAIGATPPPLPRPPMVPTRRPRPQLRRLSPLRSPGFARTAYPIRMTCWTSSTTWPPCAR